MTTIDQEWTICRLLNWTADYFKSKGLDDPVLSAQLLLAKVLGCSKVDLYLRYEQVVTQPQRDDFRELVKRASEGEPIAYLIGHKEFFSLDFLVSSSVLIPRPETELLVQWVIRKVREQPQQSPEILDIGTGSGCIAIALAKFLPKPMNITAVDKSQDALELAKSNAERHKMRDAITFMAGDLFSRLDGPKKRFSFIVSNPPYVTEEDYSRLPKSIKMYEPADALLAGTDGLAVVKRIIAEAGEYLKSDGYLVMEIGYNQSETVLKLFQAQGYKEIEFERDAADIPRIVIGRK
ncbi:MAG: peptide chain release factor N(5)-glutamine methyltransferase [Phycisphaerae bacterium]